MIARLGSLVEQARTRLDRGLLHTAIKAGVAIAFLSVAAHHVHGKRAFDKSALEKLATKAARK